MKWNSSLLFSGLTALMFLPLLAGDNAKAIELQDRLMPLHRALFLESSPAPTKYALSLLGKCKPDVRMPIIPLVKDGTKRAIEAAMRHAGILN